MRSISPTSVRMLIDESQQADIVQGYAYHARTFYQACQSPCGQRIIAGRSCSTVDKEKAPERMPFYVDENVISCRRSWSVAVLCCGG